MTTAADLVNETKRLLLSGHREQMNTLAQTVDASETTLTFSHDLREIQQDAYLSIDTEILYVWEATQSSNTIVVERGIGGSTPAAHSAGTFAFPNPPFSGLAIFKALNDDLADLSASGLYKVNTVVFDWNPAIFGYDMAGATDVIDVLRVRYETPGPENDWPESLSFRLVEDADQTDFPSGWGVVVRDAYPGRAVRVTYSSRFTPFADLTTDLTDTGLPVTAYDLPPLGAAVKLAGIREVERNLTETQGPTRRATEVGVNAQVAGMQAMLSLRTRRLNSEVARLTSDYPPRRSIPA
jgi:hypothetical protein